MYENIEIHSKCYKSLHCQTCCNIMLPSFPKWSPLTFHVYPTEIQFGVLTFLMSLKRIDVKFPKDIKYMIISTMVANWIQDMIIEFESNPPIRKYCMEKKCKYDGFTIGSDVKLGKY